ncbi:hypothetical protein GYA49_00895 [Candidatus Beckwithbacteria bacterium]|nr:hypothetical protein [Candidatus Beckwithbacteria bacterium]
MKPFNFKQLSFFAYNLEAGRYLENFMIMTVSSVLVIRVFLSVTNYARLGNTQLHIAHMLWGGLFMMIALVFAMAFLNKEAKYVASIVGGIGFGFFIDELGKFITEDNDYFFEPTFAIMYVIFVLMFFAFRTLDKKIKLDQKDYAINGLELVKEIIFSDLDQDEKARALAYFAKAKTNDEVTKSLKQLVQSIKVQPVAKRNILSQAKYYLKKAYLDSVKNRLSARLLTTIFIIGMMISIAKMLLTVDIAHSTFWDWGTIISTLIAGILVLMGVYLLQRKKRRKAYEKFKQSLLVLILLTQFFSFYHHQLVAVLWLIAYITVYVGLQYLIEQEKVKIN